MTFPRQQRRSLAPTAARVVLATLASLAVVFAIAPVLVVDGGGRAASAQALPRPVRRHLKRAVNPPRQGELCFSSVRDSIYFDISLIDLASGITRRITRQSSPVVGWSWSPDGGRLALMTEHDRKFEIYTMAADGSDWRRITDTQRNDYFPEWSPDGQHIAYSEDVDSGRNQIFVVSPDGSNRVQLTFSATGAYGPKWSPDGTRIAYDSGQRIMVMNSNGSNPRSLYSTTAEKETTDWSPDGTRILFMMRTAGLFKLHTIRLADFVVEEIPTGELDAWCGRWSPDGSLISFYSYGVGSVGFNDGMSAVWVMNADGSDLRQVTTLTPDDRSNYPIWRR